MSKRPKSQTGRITTLSIIILILLSISGCNGYGRVLSAEETRILFAGKTVKGYHEKKDYRFESYYEPNGHFRSYQNGSPTPRLGRWWVTEQGDICISWHDETGELCRKMMVDDAGQYRKVLFKSSGKRVLIVTFESFVSGNMNNRVYRK